MKKQMKYRKKNGPDGILFQDSLFTENSETISDQYLSNTGSSVIITNLIQTHGHRSSAGHEL